MLDLGWSELLVVAVVLIVVVGPKDLPKMLRTFGKTTASLRKMAGDFRRQLDDAIKDSEFEDVRKIATDLKGLDPRNQIRESLAPLGKVGQDINKELKKAASEIEQPPASTQKAASTEREPYPWEVPAAEPVNPDALKSPEDPAKAKSSPASKSTSTKSTSAKTTPAKPKTAKAGAAKATTTKAASAKPAAAKSAAAPRSSAATKAADKPAQRKAADAKPAQGKTAAAKASTKAAPRAAAKSETVAKSKAAAADKPAKPATRRRTAAKKTGPAGEDQS